ncbi:MAG: hypothetical protein ACLTK0_09510 [Anaerovoracaceae bacterium]
MKYSNSLKRRLSTLMIVVFLIMSLIIVAMGSDGNIMPVAFAGEFDEAMEESVQPLAASTVGSFSFSYTKGHHVDGSTNSKYYSLKKGDHIKHKVESITGATSSSKVSLSLRYKEGTNTYVVGTAKVYQTGTYEIGTLISSTKYYLYAKGGSGKGFYKRITGSGKLLCS